jgi:hypothetical protein
MRITQKRGKKNENTTISSLYSKLSEARKLLPAKYGLAKKIIEKADFQLTETDVYNILAGRKYDLRVIQIAIDLVNEYNTQLQKVHHDIEDVLSSANKFNHVK